MAEPNLRFKRDDGTPFPAWADVRFGDVFTEIVRKTSDTETFPLFSLTIENGVTAKTDRYERSHLLKKDEDNYKIVPPWAFVYNPMNLRFGALAASHENREVCVSQYYNVFVLNDETTLSFWENYLVSDAMLQYYFSIATGSLIEKLRVHFSSFVNITKPIPCADEQQKIADFLSSVDEVIAASEEEVTNLETQKKAVMQKIFSQEVRFKRSDGTGFSEWEEDELGSLCEPHARIGWQNLRTDEFLDAGDYYLVTGTDFVDGHVNFSTCHYIDKDRYEMDKNIQIQNEDILITKDGTLGKVAIVKGMDKPGTLNAGVFVLQNITNNLDHEYLYQYLAAPFLITFAREKSTGGTIQHLNQGVLVQFSVPIPCLEEQRLIADFLSDFDEAIGAAKKELELWKDLKKGLLQQMFI